jgi:hypothetical protein
MGKESPLERGAGVRAYLLRNKFTNGMVMKIQAELAKDKRS